MVGNMNQTANSSFTYDNNLTPQISGLSPNTTTVIGELRVVFVFLITFQWGWIIVKRYWEERSDNVLWYGEMKSWMEDGSRH